MSAEKNNRDNNDSGIVLVTGAAGLVGNELVHQLLQNGFTVKALYHRTPLKNFDNRLLQIQQCDLLDVFEVEDAMKDVSRVFHCAGLVSFSPNQRDELYKINVEVTANVVNAALHAGVQKMVHVSSVAATGRRRNGMRIEETMYWTPETGNSLYAQSKYLAEMEVWRGIAEGLDAAIVNPSIIFGAGDWTDGSTAIFKKVYDGLKWYSEGVTGFVDVEDVCKAMIMLMYSDVSRERFIISAHNAAYKDVMEKIADGFNLKRPHKKVTPFLAGLIWRIDYLKSIFSKKSRLITKETAATALDKVYFDNSKFLRFFPQFSYKDLSDTIQECCKQLLEKNK